MELSEIISIIIVATFIVIITLVFVTVAHSETKCVKSCEDKGLLLLESAQNYCKCVNETGGIFYTKPTK